MTIHVHIVMEPTFCKNVDMLLGERHVHNLNLIGSMVFLFVVVEIDITMIVQIPLPLLC